MSKGWDNATLKKLKALTGKGLSTSEIGKRLGMSKNAIVGKLNRLGWNAKAGGAVVSAPAKAEKKAESSSVITKVVEKITAKKTTAKAAPAAPKKEPVKATAKKTTTTKPNTKTRLVCIQYLNFLTFFFFGFSCLYIFSINNL